MVSMTSVQIPVEIVTDRQTLIEFIERTFPDCDPEEIVSRMFVENVVMAGDQFVRKTLETQEMTGAFQKNFESIWNEGYEAGFTDATEVEGHHSENPYEPVAGY